MNNKQKKDDKNFLVRMYVLYAFVESIENNLMNINVTTKELSQKQGPINRIFKTQGIFDMFDHVTVCSMGVLDLKSTISQLMQDAIYNYSQNYDEEFNVFEETKKEMLNHLQSEIALQNKSESNLKKNTKKPSADDTKDVKSNIKVEDSGDNDNLYHATKFMSEKFNVDVEHKKNNKKDEDESNEKKEESNIESKSEDEVKPKRRRRKKRSSEEDSEDQ